jgi:glycosyltransferase involved in cell wall biosynthesis
VHVPFLQDFHLTPEIVSAGRLLVSPLGSDVVPPPDLGTFPPEVAQQRRDLLRMGHAVSVCSRAFATDVAAFAGIDVDRIAVVPMGVDLAQFRPVAREPAHRLTVGFFKGFRPVYGPTVLLSAIPKVLAQVPNACFELIGHGDLLPECRAMAFESGAGDAIAWGDPCPYDRLSSVIGRWDLSVVPSFCESFCVAALESQAMEVPVVASHVGGLPETVRDGETGVLVPPGDADALAHAIVVLLSDGARRREMGQAGRRFVTDRYEWSACLDQWEMLYEQVAGGAAFVGSARSDSSTMGADLSGSASLEAVGCPL